MADLLVQPFLHIASWKLLRIANEFQTSAKVRTPKPTSIGCYMDICLIRAQRQVHVSEPSPEAHKNLHRALQPRGPVASTCREQLERSYAC